MFSLLHIGIAVVVLQVLGFIWYGKLFGKRWAVITGMDMPQNMSPEANRAFRKRMVPIYILNILSTVVIVLTFNFLLYASLLTSLGLALVLFVGIALVFILGNSLWSGKPRRLAQQMFLIQAGYQLLAFIVLWLLFM